VPAWKRLEGNQLWWCHGRRRSASRDAIRGVTPS